jgi:hypothetical protein
MKHEKKEMAGLIIRHSLAYQCQQIVIVTGDFGIRVYPIAGSVWSQPKLQCALEMAEIMTCIDYDHEKKQCYLQLF